jgi:hypothetical protein
VTCFDVRVWQSGRPTSFRISWLLSLRESACGVLKVKKTVRMLSVAFLLDVM